MFPRGSVLLIGLAGVLGCFACAPRKASERVIYTNALDSMDDVLSQSGISVDVATSQDGEASIRIDASEPVTIRLAEVEPEAAENAVLIYRAHLRSENLTGQAYLEMWCSVPGKGEFFSRALQAPLSGTTSWVAQETPFFLEKGQRAQTVKLNVVVAGSGVVWVDAVALAQASR